VLASKEQLEVYKASSNFRDLADRIWSTRKTALAREGLSVGSVEEFRAFLNKIVAQVMAGPDDAIAVNHRLSVALQGTTVHWKLHERNLPNEDIAEAKEFVDGAVDEFGISLDEGRRRRIAKRYSPMFTEAYRRKLKGGPKK